MKENVYLIIHGYGGNPEEIDYLACYLRQKDFDVRTVLLAGHGGTKYDLKKYSYLDWINSVNIIVDMLKQEYININIIGFSMGGLICTHFASMPEINKVVFINGSGVKSSPAAFWRFFRHAAPYILTNTYSIAQYKGHSLTKKSLKNRQTPF